MVGLFRGAVEGSHNLESDACIGAGDEDAFGHCGSQFGYCIRVVLFLFLSWLMEIISREGGSMTLFIPFQ